MGWDEYVDDVNSVGFNPELVRKAVEEELKDCEECRVEVEVPDKLRYKITGKAHVS